MTEPTISLARAWYAKFLTACICFAILGAIPIIVVMSLNGFDSLSKRKKVSARIDALADEIRSGRRSPESIRQLEEFAKRSYRFGRCRALHTLGTLGAITESTIPTMVEGLKDSDPFVRDAAARGMYEMGQLAAPARDALAGTITLHVNESAARYAAMALREIGDDSTIVLESLKFAAHAPDSVGREEARKTYQELTGKSLASIKEKD